MTRRISYTDRVRRSLELVFAVCAAALAGTVLVSTLTGASSGSITVAVTLVLAVAVRVAIGSLHTLDLALLALAFVLSIHGATPRDLGMLMSPLLIGLGLKVRRTVRALLLVLSAVAVLTALGLASPQPRAAVVDQILFNAIGSIAIVIGVRVLMQAGHRADSAYRDLTSALVRDRVFTARREALLDYLRLLRDEIMGTLTLIREAAMAEGLAEQMRDACRRAARAARDAVEAPGSRSATDQEISLTGLADIVAHLSPPGVTVRSRAASAGSLPDELAWAVLLQARQAMTALGGTEFMLDLEVSREGLVLSGSGQVIRIGTGDPRTASSLRATYDATVEGLSSTGLVLLGLLAPLSQLPLALRYTAISEHPGWSLLLLAAYAALTALVLRTLHSGPPRPLEIVGFSAAVSLLSGCGIWLAGPDSLADLRSWQIGLGGVLLALVTAVVPGRWVPILLAPHLLVVAIIGRIREPADLVVGIGALVASVLPGALAYLIGRWLRTLRGAVRAEAADLAALAYDQAGLPEAQAAGYAALGDTLTRAARFLDQVAGGEIPPSLWAGGAELLAARVRDEMALPGVLDAQLQDRLDTLRTAGTTIVFAPPTGALLDPRHPLRMLDRALDLATPDSRISIDLATATEPVTRIWVVPPLPASVVGGLADHLRWYGGRLDTSSVLTTIQVPAVNEVAEVPV